MNIEGPQRSPLKKSYQEKWAPIKKKHCFVPKMTFKKKSSVPLHFFRNQISSFLKPFRKRSPRSKMKRVMRRSKCINYFSRKDLEDKWFEQCCRIFSKIAPLRSRILKFLCKIFAGLALRDRINLDFYRKFEGGCTKK